MGRGTKWRREPLLLREKEGNLFKNSNEAGFDVPNIVETKKEAK